MTLSYMSTQPQLLWRTAGINKLFTLGESKFTGTTLSVGGISKHSFPYAGEQFVCYRWKPIREWSRLKAPFFLSKQTIRPVVHPKNTRKESKTWKVYRQISETTVWGRFRLLLQEYREPVVTPVAKDMVTWYPALWSVKDNRCKVIWCLDFRSVEDNCNYVCSHVTNRVL